MDQFLSIQNLGGDSEPVTASLESQQKTALETRVEACIESLFAFVPERNDHIGFSFNQALNDSMEEAKRFFKTTDGLRLLLDPTQPNDLGLEDYYGDPYPDKPADHDVHPVSADHAIEELEDILEHEMKLDLIEFELSEIGGVNHEIAESLESIMPGVLSRRCNLRSFTDELSKVNYTASLEEIDNIRKGLAIAGGIAGLAVIIKIIMWVRGMFKKSSGSTGEATKAEEQNKSEGPKVEVAAKEYEQQMRTIRVDHKQMSSIIEKLKDKFGDSVDVPERAGDPAALMDRIKKSVYDKFLDNFFFVYVNEAIKKDPKQATIKKYIDVANVLAPRLAAVAALLAHAVKEKEPYANPDQYKIEMSLYSHVENFPDTFDSRELVNKLNEKLGAINVQLTTKSNKEINLEEIYRAELVSVFTEIDEKAIEGLENLEKLIKQMNDDLSAESYPLELKKSYLGELRKLTDHWRAYGNIMRTVLMARHRITKFEIELSKIIRRKQAILVGNAVVVQEVLLDEAPPNFAERMRLLFSGT